MTVPTDDHETRPDPADLPESDAPRSAADDLLEAALKAAAVVRAADRLRGEDDDAGTPELTSLSRVEGAPDLDATTGARRRRWAIASASVAVVGAAVGVALSRPEPSRPVARVEPAEAPTPAAPSAVAAPTASPAELPSATPEPPGPSADPVVQPAPEAVMPLPTPLEGSQQFDDVDEEAARFAAAYEEDFYGEDYLYGLLDDVPASDEGSDDEGSGAPVE